MLLLIPGFHVYVFLLIVRKFQFYDDPMTRMSNTLSGFVYVNVKFFCVHFKLKLLTICYLDYLRLSDCLDFSPGLRPPKAHLVTIHLLFAAKNSTSVMSNIPPPGVTSVMSTPYIMGQVPYFQQPVYSFEDMQLLQQRLPHMVSLKCFQKLLTSVKFQRTLAQNHCLSGAVRGVSKGFKWGAN